MIAKIFGYFPSLQFDATTIFFEGYQFSCHDQGAVTNRNFRAKVSIHSRNTQQDSWRDCKVPGYAEQAWSQSTILALAWVSIGALVD